MGCALACWLAVLEAEHMRAGMVLAIARSGWIMHSPVFA